MPTDRRRDAATAVVGAGGMATGGVMRHVAVKDLEYTTGRKPKVHLMGVLRHGNKPQKRVFVGGSLLGLTSAAPLAVGASRLVSEDVGKRDKEKRSSFLSEGLRGSAEALRGRGEAVTQPVPKEVRATQLGVAIGAGLGGSALARQAMKGRLKPAVSPVVGGLAATASIPLTNKLVSSRGYEVTAYGVKRAKTAPKRPSTQSFRHRAEPRSFREDLSKSMLLADLGGAAAMKGKPLTVGQGLGLGVLGGGALAVDRRNQQRRRARQQGLVLKADDYLGSRTGYNAQRAAITLAGHPPIIGPITQASTAAAYAPPGQGRKQGLRQYGMASLAPVGVGIAGAHAGARMAEKSPGFARQAERFVDFTERAEGRMRRAVGMKPKTGPGRIMPKVKSTKMGARLFRSRAAGLGATAGFLGSKMAAGAIGGQAAISLNQRDQSRYNAKHGISKAGPRDIRTPFSYQRRFHPLGRPLRTTDQIQADNKVKLDAATERLAASRAKLERFRGQQGIWSHETGAGRADLKPATVLSPQGRIAKADLTRPEKKQLATTKNRSAYLSAVGGTAGLTSLALMAARKKDAALWAATAGGAVGGTNALLNTKIQRKEAKQLAPVNKAAKSAEAIRRANNLAVAKRDSLEIKYKDEHPKLLSAYGDRGPLPKGLDRETKMKAYEARYAHHGGDKADRWGRRAERAEQVRNAGLAGATVGGAGWLAARTKGGKRLLQSRAGANPGRVKFHADTAAVASGTAGAGAELYGEYARNKRSSYTNSPAGVAGSALRRMRDYTPE